MGRHALSKEDKLERAATVWLKPSEIQALERLVGANGPSGDASVAHLLARLAREHLRLHGISGAAKSA